MAKMEGSVSIGPCHENSDVSHVFTKRRVKLDIYVMFARNGTEPNDVEGHKVTFSVELITPRGIRIG